MSTEISEARPVRAAPRAIDVALQLWRAKWLMTLVFLPFVLLSVGIALALPTHYTATTRLLVSLGGEYVYDPVVGDAARGAFPQVERVLQAESELAASPIIADRVIAKFTIDRLYPELRSRPNAEAAALKAFMRDFDAEPAVRSQVLRLSYRSHDPDLAADVLNAAVDIYLERRREVLIDPAANAVAPQREALEQELATAESALQAFLAVGGVTDFETESAALAQSYARALDERLSVDAVVKETEARVRGLEQLLAATPRQIDLYVDPQADGQLAELKLEREQLLARYRPDSQTVTDIERRIAQIEGAVASSPLAGARRVGPNPTRQALEADLGTARADLAAATGRAAALVQQLRSIEDRRQDLIAMSPDYQKLKRDRDALVAAVGSLAERGQEERSRKEFEKVRSDSISIYEPARAPSEGRSGGRTVAIVGAVMGLLTALVAGLLNALSRPGAPRAGALEHAVGLRVLASLPAR